MALVIDASVALGWILRTQATPLTYAALSLVESNFGLVPAHFGIEVTRVLRTRERRRLLAADAVDIGLSLLRALPVREDDSRAIDQLLAVVGLARQHQLRVTDAAYLELALRSSLPLATRDASLTRAARAAGAMLFET